MGTGRRLLVRFLTRVLGLTELDNVTDQSARECGLRSIFQVTGQRLGMTLRIARDNLQGIPTEGPVIVYANHPTGGMEGVTLPAMLDAIRADVRILGHTWFRRWPRLAERMIMIDPQATGADRAAKGNVLKAAVRWVRDGHMLFMFPAGEVARRSAGANQAIDLPWQPGLATLVRLTRATVLPIHVCGRNSWLYYLLSSLHPRLGALHLGREILNKRGSAFRARVGRPIRFADLPPASSAEELTAFLRRAVEDLAPPQVARRCPLTALGRDWI